MLAKCVNTACSAKFRYFHEGKLFAIESRIDLPRRGPPSDPEYAGSPPLSPIFLVAFSCCRAMTVQSDGDHGVAIMRKRGMPGNVSMMEDGAQMIACWVYGDTSTTRKRGNPNWGRPIPPAPALATEFELRVRQLQLTPDMYLPGHGLQTGDVYGAVCYPAHSRLAGAMAGDACRPRAEDRTSAANPHRTRCARVLADGKACSGCGHQTLKSAPWLICRRDPYNAPAVSTGERAASKTRFTNERICFGQSG